MPKRKSWVWQHAHRDGDKAFCDMCDEGENNVFSCVGGTTGSLSRHLTSIHNLRPPTECQQISDIADEDDYCEYSNENADPENSQRSRKRRKRSQPHPSNTSASRLFDPKRTEQIHQALAKLIVMNQLPLSFCSSIGFQNFMSVVDSNYKPCKEEAIKKRLTILKSTIEDKIKKNLSAAKNVVCTTDCWSSLSPESYITVNAHIINSEWQTISYTLTTHEMEERHTAENLADELRQTFNEWGITEKVTAIVTDNAKNMVNAIALISETVEISSITCAAHTVQLAINTALKEENVQQLIRQCSKVVGHFKHSTIAKAVLEQKQEQLDMQKTTLLQCCSTRWNSTFLMLDRLNINRCPVSNTIADRTVTTSNMAKKLEITENQWGRIESLLNILKPLQIVTTLLCTESHSPISMVRPLIRKVIEKHLILQDDDDESITTLKNTIITELVRRFNLDGDRSTFVTLYHISCFFDPRYKNLEHEPVQVRDIIRTKVKRLLEASPLSTTNSNQKKTFHKTALEYLYNNDERNEMTDLTVEYDTYVAESQLRFDFDAFEWWKMRTTKYPRIANLALKYLLIPATSVTSERTFSTAGNIVTPKRSRLLPENVNTLVFLYQNRELIE